MRISPQPLKLQPCTRARSKALDQGYKIVALRRDVLAFGHRGMQKTPLRHTCSIDNFGCRQDFGMTHIYEVVLTKGYMTVSSDMQYVQPFSRKALQNTQKCGIRTGGDYSCADIS